MISAQQSTPFQTNNFPTGSVPSAGSPLKQFNRKMNVRSIATVLGLTAFFVVAMAAVFISMRTRFGAQDFSLTAPDAPSADVIRTASCTLSFSVAAAEEPPVCGGPCGTGNTCPTGHSCNAQGTCVINECLGNEANCSENGCRVNPTPTPTPTPPGSTPTPTPTPPGSTPTPTPTPPGATPTPTPLQPLSECRGTCSTDNDCADGNHVCHAGECRLRTNVDNQFCQNPDGSTPTPQPRDPQRPPQSVAKAHCNQACTINSDCSNGNHICQDGACRLATNPMDANCSLPQVAQPVLPEALPQSGAGDIQTWLKAGLGILGIGALMLLLL